MRRHTIQAAAAVVGAVLVLGGLIAGGRALRGRLGDDDRYQLPFTKIQCESAPGTTQDEFLSEVRYLGEFPERVSLLDDELPKKLKDAFERHGWVESAKVSVGPGRRLAAALTFRTPVLAVRFADDVRAVDAAGVLLPRTAATAGLPQLSGAKAPSGGPGKPWGDAGVEAAAKVAGVLHAHQGKLKLMALGNDADGRLTLRRRAESWPVVEWGNAPGNEADGEPTAQQKLQRLLDLSNSPTGLDDPNSRKSVKLHVVE
jgi:hypothetical protein